MNEGQENSTIKKQGFFSKVWNSISKIENYPDMAAQGVGRAFSYLAKIVIIITIVLCFGTIYQTNKLIQEGVQYLQSEFPEFSYTDGILNIDSQEPIIIEEADSKIGKTIIDTNTEDAEKINQYSNSIEEVGSGVVILKEKVILKNTAVAGTIEYNYKSSLENMGITEFNKQDIINYTSSSNIINLYVSVFLVVFLYAFIMYYLTTLSNVILLSVFGYIAALITRIRMRYVAIFNMSVYAITLSVLLNAGYILVNTFIDFRMEYFQVMYIAVAAIYLVAAIFILKTELNKKQQELIKIAEAEAIVKKEIQQEEKENAEKDKKNPKDKENTEKKENTEEKEKKENEDNNVGKEPEGSNA